MELEKEVRVRFAPSPTGLLHIGGLRTALYNFVFARQQKGRFILRIEDTDRERYHEEAEKNILDALQWAGLGYDEGPLVGGPHAPYYQSQRGDSYRDAAERLIQDGHAYYAFDTHDELEQMRTRLLKAGNPSPRYDAITRMSMRNSITLPSQEVDRLLAEGAPHVIRLKVPRRETVRFQDLIRGWVSFESQGIDDQVLLKSDGMPTYHLANVVDDYDMGISHVIRGEEWLSSTPKHILMYEYLGWTAPKLAHLPLILSPAGGKLSKRNADELGIPVSVEQYRDAGYEPEALLNFLALLGWNPGDDREIFSLDELVETFSLERIGSSGIQFNLDKLRWFNQQYLRSKPPKDLAGPLLKHVMDQHPDVPESYVVSVVSLLQDRITLRDDLINLSAYFFDDPAQYDTDAVARLKPEAPDHLTALAHTLERTAEVLSAADAESVMHETAEGLGVKPGALMFPARLAVTGMTVGPALFDSMALIGRAACLRRIRRAAARFQEYIHAN
ncbi:MAG TPA: glutamate--tRNA ligase [Rhodothermales bacterium]|nr:glutamate--tRNA ligase [Rhodothermales bacterium]